MIKKQVIFLLLFFLVEGIFAQQLVVKNPLRFLALGDSYTIGQRVLESERWPNQLADALKPKGIETEKLTIIARTAWRTDNLQNAILTENPDSTYNLVSLLIGVNNQYQGKNINAYTAEFRQLLNTAIALCGGNKEGVFVLSIPDYGYTPFGWANQSSISAEIDQYNQINKNIAGEMGVAWFDITSISREAIVKPEYLASDNLHPSGEMYARWVELILNSSKIKILTSNSKEFKPIEKVNVFPNPAKEFLTLELPSKPKNLRITNSQGSLVWQAKEKPTNSYHIDISKWSGGMYFFQVILENNKHISGKILIE